MSVISKSALGDGGVAKWAVYNELIYGLRARLTSHSHPELNTN